MKMGEGGAFVAGGVVGGAIAGTFAYKAGYDQRDAELQPYINSLQNQLNTKDQHLLVKDREIAGLRKELDEKTRSIPVISHIQRKLRGS